MLNRLSLRHQIYLILGSLVVIVIVGGVIIINHSKRMESLMLEIVDKGLVRYQMVEKMETALVNQKGFVTYFFMDQDPGWLEQLGIYRQVFKERLEEIALLENIGEQKQKVEEAQLKYSEYITQMNRVIDYYKKGDIQKGYLLHLQEREKFFKIMKACESLKEILTDRIRENWLQSRLQSRRLVASVITIAVIVCVLGILLIAILVTRILDPLQLLARQSKQREEEFPPQNEIQQLKINVNELIENAGHAQEELKQSRAILVQSEKLALVGKLAAGMAHSIRNPLTSVKMRLFSLGRTLEFTPSQKDDFDVISEEIRHLDIIVQNFLEFSRPPKLTMQLNSPSAVVDQSLQLLTHRLKSYNVSVIVNRSRDLPAIQCDPEQLKEVFVNLIVNACEAMKSGGEIVIEEKETVVSSRKVNQIRLIDNGPGMPENIIDNIFQPFFSTKDEGTGLGLSIAMRIVSDHGGQLDVSSEVGVGTTFSLTFPIDGAES